MPKLTIEELKDDLKQFFEKEKKSEIAEPLPDKRKPSLTSEPDEVAIIGMACRFPESPTSQILWENLTSGKNLFKRIPADRFESNDEAAILSGIDEFDASLFKISPLEAEVMDPHQRVLLQVAWEAFEDAGYPLSQLAGSKVGVFIAMYNTDYVIRLSETKDHLNPFFATGASQAAVSNRISYVFDLRGPSEVISTACSSALVALHHAVQAIKSGESSMAVVGGVNLLLTPHRLEALSNLGIMSTAGYCAPFDKDSPGEILGEGVGVVILKARKLAERDGDTILGLVKASAVGHHGHSSGSLTMPSVSSQSDIIVDTYTTYGIDPATIGYIEGHGSGNKDADMVELIAFEDAFKKLSKAPLEKHACGVGSVKGSLGFGEASGGMAQLIKVLLCLRHGEIPATRSFKEADPAAHLEESPLYVVKENQSFGIIAQQPRRAAIHAYGLAGTSAHVVIEEAPPRTIKETPIKPYYLLTLSANTEQSLAQRIVDLSDWLKKDENRKFSLAQIAYTLNMGRNHFNYRVALVADSLETLKVLLDKINKKQASKDYYQATTNSVREDEAIYKKILEVSTQELAADQKQNTEHYKNNLLTLANLYVKGYDLDWKILHQGEEKLKISLPTYPFAKDVYRVPENKAKTLFVDDKTLAPQTSGILSARTTEISSSPAAGLAQLERELMNLIAQELKLKENNLDINASLINYGLNSLLMIRMLDKIENHYGKKLSSTALIENPSIKDFANYLASKGVVPLASMQTQSSNKQDQEEVEFDLKDILGNKNLYSKMIHDSELDATILNANLNKFNPQSKVRNILLTGATGFLGAYVLKDLLEYYPDSTIYCLVRARNSEEAKTRIMDNLTKNNLHDIKNLKNIHPILGDLGKRFFDLTEKSFAKLGGKIDAIYHVGAFVNHIYTYDLLRDINVLGTHEIIRLACCKKIKPIYFVSSIASDVRINPTQGNKTFITEENIDNPEGTFSGYQQTKWVCERLLSKARDVGIPSIIFKPGEITGDIYSEESKHYDVFHMLLKFMLEIGKYPDPMFGEINMVPVDYVSKVIVHLSKRMIQLDKSINIINPKPAALKKYFLWCRKKEYTMEEVSQKLWMKACKERIDQETDSTKKYLLKVVFSKFRDGLVLNFYFVPVRHSSREIEEIDCPSVEDLFDKYFTKWLSK